MAEALAVVPDLDVTVNGTKVDAKNVEELRVVDNVRLPDSCVIRMGDAGMKLVDDDVFRPGAELEIKLQGTADKSSTPVTIFKGLIISIEPEFLPAHKKMTIRAYDYAYPLHVNSSTETYKDVTPGDIVKKIASRNGLSPQVDSGPSVTKKVLQQSNESDWEFLWNLADHYGYEVLVDTKKKLIWRKAGKDQGSPITVTYPTSLISFRPRVTAAGSLTEVTVNGWDPKSKKAITSTKKPQEPPQKPAGLKAAQVRTAMSGSKSMVNFSRPISTQADADAHAQSHADDHAAQFMEGTAVAQGNPKLTAGCKVKLEGLGKRFSGEFPCGSTEHVYKAGRGYTTILHFNGRASRSLVDLTNPAKKPKFSEHLVVGVVSNTKDPDKLGRIKVKYPGIGDKAESDWARIVSPHAGDSKRGMFVMPQVGDEVVIGFHHQNQETPLVMGSVYQGKSQLGDPAGQEQADGKGKGHTDLGIDEGSFQLKSPKSYVGTFDQHISQKAGRNYSLQVGQDSQVKVTGNHKEEVTGTHQTKSTGAMKMESSATINIKATGQCTIEADGPVNVKSSAALKLEAPMIDINASGMLNLKGSMINLG